jgi:arylsulfatase A-like enzyme
VAAPGGYQPGEASDQPVSLLDIFPTLNELCGLPSATKLDGVSLVPLMENPNIQTGRAVVTTQGLGNHSIRSDKWRYILYADGSEELYDQIEDSKNFHNLADSGHHDAVKQELATWLPAYEAEAHPTFNGQKAMNDKYAAMKEKR